MYSLSDEQRMLVESLESIVEREFAPRAFEWDGETPWANIELLADHGFLGANISVEYGGGGMTEIAAILMIETVGRVCPDTAQFLYEQQMIAPRAIDLFGTETAKERFIPPVTAGEETIAIAISEPEAGSDISSMTTTIEESNSELVLDGEKIWVSRVETAGSVVVWAKFPDGLGTVVVDMDDSGISVGEPSTNMAGAQQCQIYFEDVSVPTEQVLTRGREGVKKQLGALNWERLGSAALGNAFARCALEKALDYGQTRKQFDQPIADFQGIEWKLADMAKQLSASRTLTYSAAQQAVDSGELPSRLETSIAKLYSAEMVDAVVDEALQIHGANGYQQEHPLEYLYRMARGRRIAAGTDEIQKNSIAAVLKDKGLGSFP